jgi:ribosome recycling factor
MDIEEIQLDTEERMAKAVEVFVRESKGLRTGRANPALIENVKVECYGAVCPLKEVASITAPDPRMLVVKPYDASILRDIDKAIQKSDLGLNPSSDGKLLRITIPPLSEERRKQMVATLKEHAEKAKVAVRNVRRDGNKAADQAVDEGTCSEDDGTRCREAIQDLTKEHEGKIDAHLKAKSEEILAV